MYKKPSTRVQRTQLIALYVGMTLVVLTVVAILLLVVLNYGFNRQTGMLEQRGLVQFASTPSGATVEVDGTAISSKTSTKYSVDPGVRRFDVWREGYETWELTTNIDAGSLVWLNYVRLVPKNRNIETVRQYDSSVASVASPNNRAILVQTDPKIPEFRYVDITRDQPTARIIQLPKEVYEPTDDTEKEAEAHQPSTYTIDRWDESGRYVLLWKAVGSSKQLIMLDTEDPSRTVNVTREFSLPISNARFSGRSGNVLYVVSDGAIRKLNIGEGTASRVLVAHVTYFDLYDAQTLVYVAQTEALSSRTVGVYREGDKAPTTLQEIKDKDAPVSIAAASYYGTTYTVIAEGKNARIYKGQFDRGMSGLELLTSMTLQGTIQKVEFNDASSHVVVRTTEGFASYNIDRKLTNYAKVAKSQDMFWIDSMHLGLVQDGTLSMMDVDGTNRIALGKAAPFQAVTLSRNGTYLYSFGEREGHSTFQRIRMILP